MSIIFISPWSHTLGSFESLSLRVPKTQPGYGSRTNSVEYQIAESRREIQNRVKADSCGRYELGCTLRVEFSN